MIIWLNGGFGAGKTTLAAELHRRLPDAVVFDPEQVGSMLWKSLPPGGDFQHLPSWRELVVATALTLRRHHAATLIVPMSLVRDAYRAEILGGLTGAGEEVLHVFLAADAGVLRERRSDQLTPSELADEVLGAVGGGRVGLQAGFLPATCLRRRCAAGRSLQLRAGGRLNIRSPRIPACPRAEPSPPRR